MTPGLSVLRVSVCRVRCAMHVSCRRWHPARGDARSLRTPAVIPPGIFLPAWISACLSRVLSRSGASLAGLLPEGSVANSRILDFTFSKRPIFIVFTGIEMFSKPYLRQNLFLTILKRNFRLNLILLTHNVTRLQLRRRSRHMPPIMSLFSLDRQVHKSRFSLHRVGKLTGQALVYASLVGLTTCLSMIRED